MSGYSRALADTAASLGLPSTFFEKIAVTPMWVRGKAQRGAAQRAVNARASSVLMDPLMRAAHNTERLKTWSKAVPAEMPHATEHRQWRSYLANKHDALAEGVEDSMQMARERGLR